MKRYTYQQFTKFIKESNPRGSVFHYKWICSPFELNQLAKLNNINIKNDPENIGHVIGFRKGDKKLTFRYDQDKYILYSDYTMSELLHRTRSDLKEKKEYPIIEEEPIIEGEDEII